MIVQKRRQGFVTALLLLLQLVQLGNRLVMFRKQCGFVGYLFSFHGSVVETRRVAVIDAAAAAAAAVPAAAVPAAAAADVVPVAASAPRPA